MIPHSRRINVFHGERIYYSSGWDLLETSLNLYKGADWHQLKPGQAVATSTITNCYRVTIANGKTVFFKCYSYHNRRRWRYFLRPAKPTVEVFGYHQLQRLNIPTLEVVALGERRWYGCLRSAFVITKGIDETTDLEVYARCASKDPVIAILRQLADQLRVAHAANFFHQDLHWRNVLISDSSAIPIWIDCPRANILHLGFRRRHAMVKDITCLIEPALDWLSVSEKVRLLHIYLGDKYSKKSARHLMHLVQIRIDASR